MPDKLGEERLRKIRDYKEIFLENEVGQRILLDLMKESRMVGLSFDEGNPHVTSFNEGMRNIVFLILSYINTNEKDLMDLIEKGEQDARERRNTFFDE